MPLIARPATSNSEPGLLPSDRGDLPDGVYADPPFESVYAEHYRRLVGTLRLSGAPPDLAEDIAQEAFARTFARWRAVRTGANPTGYVYRIAFRLLRKSRNQRRLMTVGLDEGSALTTPEPDHAQRIHLIQQLAALPERQRACLLLNLYVGLPSQEVGQILHINASTVRVHVSRGRATLREAIADI